MHQQLTNLSEAGSQSVDWIKLAQNRATWLVYVSNLSGFINIG